MLSILFPAAAFWADRKTKAMAREGLQVVTPCPERIAWEPMENPGFACGKCKDRPKTVRHIQAACFGLTALTLLREHPRQNSWERTGAGFLLLGALSNLMDRLKRGTVTDMLRFPQAPGKLKGLVFNLADLMLLLGAVLTLIGTLRRKKKGA